MQKWHASGGLERRSREHLSNSQLPTYRPRETKPIVCPVGCVSAGLGPRTPPSAARRTAGVCVAHIVAHPGSLRGLGPFAALREISALSAPSLGRLGFLSATPPDPVNRHLPTPNSTRRPNSQPPTERVGPTPNVERWELSHGIRFTPSGSRLRVGSPRPVGSWELIRLSAWSVFQLHPSPA
jgi:hypothetical protein